MTRASECAPEQTRAVARLLVDASTPRSRDVHLIRGTAGLHLLVVDGNRLFDIDETSFAELDAAARSGDPGAASGLLAALGVTAPHLIDDVPLTFSPVRALSLAVAQKCNLGCTYCYAQEGDFGGAPKNMPLETALAAVDLLLSSAEAGERVNLAFLGGEPLANRGVLRAATEHAAALAAAKEITITFSITTNGTLVGPEDADLFDQHGFAVTVSLDGLREAHDLLRPYKSGRGSYDTILENMRPLLARQRRMQVSARVTVTPRNLRLREALDELVELGFHSVGFSPMLRSPTGRDEMGTADLEQMLSEMISCGDAFQQRIASGKRYPFANMVNAMREIHKGTHRPYPCGAGAGYLGVSADGDLSACHRFVGDEQGAMGSVYRGVDRQRQTAWLATRHVHRQEPCNSCWARYMCGGGCHHEVMARGRPACDYIRGWLHYCLEAYLLLSQRCPNWFGLAPRQPPNS